MNKKRVAFHNCNKQKIMAALNLCYFTLLFLF